MISLADFFCLRKKFLVFNFTARNLKIKYRRSFLGYFWSLLVPLAQAGVYYLVFKMVLKVQIPNYVAYIVSGVLLWTFFANSITFGIEGFATNRFLLTKIPIPLQVFPFVETISNLITLLLASPILVIVVAASGISLGWPFLLFFYYSILVALVAYGLVCLLSVLSTFFSDIKHLFNLFVQLWMYGTPIFYDEAMVPEAYRWLLLANPIALAFAGMRKAVVGNEAPDSVHLWVPAAWALGSIAFGWLAISYAHRKGLVEVL